MKRTLADGEAVAVAVGRPWSTIRTWANRYPTELPQRGRRGRRRLYAVEDAQALAARLSHAQLDEHPSAGAT